MWLQEITSCKLQERNDYRAISCTRVTRSVSYNIANQILGEANGFIKIWSHRYISHHQNNEETLVGITYIAVNWQTHKGNIGHLKTVFIYDGTIEYWRSEKPSELIEFYDMLSVRIRWNMAEFLDESAG